MDDTSNADQIQDAPPDKGCNMRMSMQSVRDAARELHERTEAAVFTLLPEKTVHHLIESRKEFIRAMRSAADVCIEELDAKAHRAEEFYRHEREEKAAHSA